MLWQMVLSIIATTALWPTLEMIYVAMTGDATEKGTNGLQFLAVIFSFPLIIIICAVVTFVLYRFPVTRYKPYLYYILPTFILIAASRVASS